MSKPQTTRTRGILRDLGPGIVTGAADNDPSGIGTYSQVGAQFGFGLLWSLLFSLPLMYAVQAISARLGRVTGQGITGNLLAMYPRWLVGALVLILVVANTINIGADISAMGAAAHLLVGGPMMLYAGIFAVLCVACEVLVPYERYAGWLKWATLVMFAYVGAAFAVHIPWREAFASTILPHFVTDHEYWLSLAAVLGTTISPYLFFWQAAQEVEEIQSNAADKPLREAPHQADRHIRRIRIDTIVGMFASAFVAYFIMLTCAATLHQQGVTHIASAAQAAEALRPVAGRFAFIVFAAGIVGTGLLAVPVLAGSSSYAVSALFGWPASLAHPASKAKGFYGVIAASTFIGTAIVFLKIDPMKALFWSAVLNAIAAVPILVLIMFASRNPKAELKHHPIPRLVSALGWLACAVMTVVAIAAVIGMFE